jgi:hypothetical protein
MWREVPYERLRLSTSEGTVPENAAQVAPKRAKEQTF